MIPFEETHYSWHTTDGSDLHFPKPSTICHIENASPTVPTEVTAELVGHQCLVNDGKVKIILENAVFLERIVGTIRHRGTDRSYTTEHQNWSLFQYTAPYASEKDILIASVSGLGLRWFLLDQLSMYTSFVTAMKLLDNDAMWDFIKAIVGSWEQGRTMGASRTAREYQQAFVDGRLKKRKLRGDSRYKIWIESPKPERILATQANP